MHFKKDIFISYAHIDNASLEEGQKGWISDFHRALEIRLSQLMGEKPVIWRDQKLQGNDAFGNEIAEQLSEVALFISVLSPRYIRSEYCNKEIRLFQEACKKTGGIKVKNKSRIFKVVKTPVPLEDHPDSVKEFLGYEFFTTDPISGRVKEFQKMFGPEAEQAYWEKLDDLAYDIKDLLAELKDEASANGASEPGIPQGVPTSADFNIYLSEASYDLKAYREDLKRDLQEHGYGILPDHHLPLIVDDFSKEVEQFLNQCDFSIHLTGMNYGIVPEGTEKSVVVLQNEIAAEKSREEALQRLIWLHPGQDETVDERQEVFVDRLKHDTGLQAGAELLETSLEEFKLFMYDKLEQLKNEQSAEPESKNKGPLQVYLICDQEDLEHIIPLEDFLFNQGFEVILPVFDGDESQVRIDHQENLKVCDVTILYYGAASELWLRSKMRELMKIAGYGRSNPLMAKAVFLAEPGNQRKERFRSNDATIINATEGFSSDKVDPFIKKLKLL